MAENIQRSKGRASGYKLDRGGTPAESGPFIGEVMNNIDPTRSGRVQVFIEDFAGPNKTDQSLWRTVSYVSPYYGIVNQTGSTQGTGSYVGNPQSYGMWMTTPDIGSKVICFFASGDPNQGYYIGSVVEAGINHMLPAIGATKNFNLDNSGQDTYFKGASQLPVTEINAENKGISENPRFFDQKKPLHSVVAGVLLQQGLINDIVRGPIGSNSQRESPSNVYGISSPGRPIYAGGLNDADIQTKLEKSQVTPQQAKVLGRRGGHTFVMDDGNLKGDDQLVRIRTAAGHQILMSDSGKCLYFIHANGQTWIELGQEGTVDVYSANSINMRSAGDINIHADRSININAGMQLNVVGKKAMSVESEMLQMTGSKALIMASDKYVGVKSDGSIALDASKGGTFGGGDALSLNAKCINLNGGSTPSVKKPTPISVQKLPDTKFVDKKGWVVEQGKIETIVTRAPTHEPYPYHNKGAPASTNLSPADPTAPSPKVQDKVDTISKVPVTNGIESADYSKQNPATAQVGNLNSQQVTGMAAQAAKDSGQKSDEISNEGGVGKYGLTGPQLESGGYLKSGTNEIYLQGSPDSFTSILRSPTVWSGKDGVTSLGQVLNDSKLQDNMQYSLYNTAFSELKSSGILTGSESANVVAPMLQAATKFGIPDTKAWLDNILPTDSQLDAMNSIGRSAQYAVDLVTTKLTDATQGFSPPIAATNTVNRTLVDQAMGDVVGNPKVELPVYVSSGLSPDKIQQLQSLSTTYTTNNG